MRQEELNKECLFIWVRVSGPVKQWHDLDRYIIDALPTYMNLVVARLNNYKWPCLLLPISHATALVVEILPSKWSLTCTPIYLQCLLHRPRWMQIQGTVETNVRKGHRSLISTLCHWHNHRTKNMNKMKMMPVSFPLASDFLPSYYAILLP